MGQLEQEEGEERTGECQNMPNATKEARTFPFGPSKAPHAPSFFACPGQH